MTLAAKLQFSSLPIRAELVTAIESLDYPAMMPVQASALPLILEGKDVLAQAQTGSGKTAAFAIGLLDKLKLQSPEIQALVLCPTRELADQVVSEIRRLASAMANTKVLALCGGKPMHTQQASLKRNAHVVVGTPGRILKHLSKGNLSFRDVKTLVLDEADRMLDMGFHDDIMQIISETPNKRQTLLFSATYPDEISKISTTIQIKPQEVRVETNEATKQIKQIFYVCAEADKRETLISVLKSYQPQSCLIFCNRKQQCQQLSEALRQHGFYAKALHSDLEQFQRDQSLIQFANNSTSLLVATDVAARGLDIKALPLVINFDLSTDPETHIHRIGRTGRAGEEGIAISLALPSETFRLRAIENFQQSPVVIKELKTLNGKREGDLVPDMATLLISAGRKDKIRPGDIVGALTSTGELSKDTIGKINVLDTISYVAVARSLVKSALKISSTGKLKGRKFRAKAIR